MSTKRTLKTAIHVVAEGSPAEDPVTAVLRFCEDEMAAANLDLLLFAAACVVSAIE